MTTERLDKLRSPSTDAPLDYHAAALEALREAELAAHSEPITARRIAEAQVYATLAQTETVDEALRFIAGAVTWESERG